MTDIAKCVFSTVAGAVVNLLGGWDAWLTSLVILMLIDIIVGLIKSIMQRSDKSKSGGLNSTSMFRGGIKKILILLLVALGALLDQVISPEEMYIRSAVAGYYIANESLSILENAAACGIPLPKVLYSALDILKKDDSNNERTLK